MIFKLVETVKPTYNISMVDPYLHIIQKFSRTEDQKPLAPLTSIGIGGPADLYYKVTDIAEVAPLITSATKLKIPFVVLGGGSNTIFADEGFRGLIIHIKAKKMELDGPYVSAESGALLSQVIQFALRHSRSGMEKMMGIPGTIGGAVRGNAGAYGIEIKDVFVKATIWNAKKGVFEADAGYLHFGYRNSTVKQNHDVILKVWLKLEEKDTTAALAEAMEIVKNRISKQPKGKCSGSFFKNPGQDLKAGYLLEQCGCKGLQVGQAQVAPEHANWIMNLGAATQKDVLELSRIMQQRVKERFNVNLEREVQLFTPTGPLKK